MAQEKQSRDAGKRHVIERMDDYQGASEAVSVPTKLPPPAGHRIVLRGRYPSPSHESSTVSVDLGRVGSIP